MRYVLPLIIVFSLLIITFSLMAQLDGAPIRSLYEEEASMLFFLDSTSSFYDVYSLKDNSSYFQMRKLGHFVAYGFLATVIYLLLIPIQKFLLRGLLAFGSASIIGLIDEVHQHFLVSRSGRILDVYINTAGSFTSVLLLGILIVLFRMLNKFKNAYFTKKLDNRSA
ncbi:VanZ family protein [Anaerobacillus sp. CMMVII]|uniref:VanZ family protein n=1 Tax=Anaerobacillus sp. CMMVII TaxID=2755588 RepID=UPI0021B83279|nr:VanZ family protein [Anaerobacillus sp. CMMVII]MCT8137680.1 VanZ family protein [Anaerobacillus sp. CMMVII]